MPKGPCLRDPRRSACQGEARPVCGHLIRGMWYFYICSLSVYVSEQVYKHFNSLEIIVAEVEYRPCVLRRGRRGSQPVRPIIISPLGLTSCSTVNQMSPHKLYFITAFLLSERSPSLSVFHTKQSVPNREPYLARCTSKGGAEARLQVGGGWHV